MQATVIMHLPVAIEERQPPPDASVPTYTDNSSTTSASPTSSATESPSSSSAPNTHDVSGKSDAPYIVSYRNMQYVHTTNTHARL